MCICVTLCMYAHTRPGASGGKKRASHPLERKLQAVVTHQKWVLGNWTWVRCNKCSGVPSCFSCLYNVISLVTLTEWLVLSQSWFFFSPRLQSISGIHFKIAFDVHKQSVLFHCLRGEKTLGCEDFRQRLENESRSIKSKRKLGQEKMAPSKNAYCWVMGSAPHA